MKSKTVRRINWVLSRVAARARRLKTRFAEIDALTSGAGGQEALPAAGLEGKTIIITGSSRGVGAAIAQSFARSGAKVVINGRNQDAVENTVKLVRKLGGVATGVTVDISDEAGARKLFDSVIREFGQVDILINNAAILGPCKKSLWEIEAAEWNSVIQVNLTGAFLCSRLAMNWMMEKKIAGRIINISTGAVRTPVPQIAPYIISKSALEALTRAMAIDAGLNGITVAGIELGSLQTEMSKSYFPWDEFQTLPDAETVAPLLIYLATEVKEKIHGRIFAAWRLGEGTRKAETLLTGPLATIPRAVFPPLKRNNEEVDRFANNISVFDRAENQHGMPGKVREALTGMVKGANFARYPDELYPSLRRALSKHLGLAEECFTFGNGSSELVERTVRTFVPPGYEVLSSEPGWFMFYRYCETHGVVNRPIPFVKANGAWNYNIESIARAISVNTRMIYLINPSNPLGIGIPKNDFRRFLEMVPAHIPIIIDEAYIEFSPNRDTVRTNELIVESDRIIIGLRTFSKFYGLAALRVGYGFARPENIDLFNRLEPLFNLSTMAETAAVKALEDDVHAADIFDNTNKERVRLESELAKNKVDFIPSETHFMLVESAAPFEKLYTAYANSGIFIPQGLFFDRYFMFPIARREQNDKNLEILFSF